jgi:cell wall-associated NlpC family hydrolase
MVLVVFVLALGGCFTFPDIIRDVRELPQDHRVYTARYASGFELVTDEDQRNMDERYNTQFFSPWHLGKSAHTLDEAVFEFKKYREHLGYGENGRRHTVAWMKSLAANARLKDYPNGGFMAITVDNTDFRVVPTSKPHFNSFEHADGYPFDNFQNSGVAVNTPVYISHVSRDKAWYLAESSFAFGWIPARNVATVDQNFIRTWEAGRYAVIIKDKAPVYNDAGVFLFKLPLGSVFPLAVPATGDGENGITLLVAVADRKGKAAVQNVAVRKEMAAVKPIKLNEANMARLANELINEPYGWGGMYQNRDCSSMVRDLFAPFGLWLPRNSGDQAKKSGGLFIDLAKLSSQEKETLIMKKGIPYLTLVWRPGHIMLYTGEYGGKALIFHNLWSIRTRDLLGRKGRKVVGHAAITTLRPGKELRIIDLPGDDLLANISGMTLLVHPPETGAAPKISGTGISP